MLVSQQRPNFCPPMTAHCRIDDSASALSAAIASSANISEDWQCHSHRTLTCLEGVSLQHMLCFAASSRHSAKLTNSGLSLHIHQMFLVILCINIYIYIYTYFVHIRKISVMHVIHTYIHIHTYIYFYIVILCINIDIHIYMYILCKYIQQMHVQEPWLHA